MDTQERNRLREAFGSFASDRSATPAVYRRLGAYVADHDDLLDVFDDIPAAKRRPVTLFAAVHYLVLRGTDHPLGHDYEAPELRGVLDQVGDHFRDFVDDNVEEIVDIMSSRNVQTNEVNRCAPLLPALMTIHREARRPLAFVELGASAGLNLLLDRFRYDYAGGPVIGPPGATVRCHCELRGGAPYFSDSVPPIDYRIGIDLDPIDIGDDDELMWLRACIWVGDVAREQRLVAAVNLARREWPTVKRGDAAELLPEIVGDVPADLELVVFNSWMMSWMPEASRLALEHTVRQVGATRPLWWVTYEWPSKVPAFAAEAGKDADVSLLGLQRVDGSGVEARKLADVAHHGNWLEWTDAPSAAR